jgi:hypothetical protein
MGLCPTPQFLFENKSSEVTNMVKGRTRSSQMQNMRERRAQDRRNERMDRQYNDYVQKHRNEILIDELNDALEETSTEEFRELLDGLAELQQTIAERTEECL